MIHIYRNEGQERPTGISNAKRFLSFSRNMLTRRSLQPPLMQEGTGPAFCKICDVRFILLCRGTYLKSYWLYLLRTRQVPFVQGGIFTKGHNIIVRDTFTQLVEGYSRPMDLCSIQAFSCSQQCANQLQMSKTHCAVFLFMSTCRNQRG